MFDLEAEIKHFRHYYKIMHKLKEIKEPSLPANTPRRTDIKLSYPPRKMFPVHIVGVNKDKKNSYYGNVWAIDLIMVSMESVRRMFGFEQKGTEKQRRKNLQIWVNHAGPALYNPLWWQIFLDGPRGPRHGGRFPHRKHPFLDRVHGTHRIRALEALDFDFVYVYFQTGNIDYIPQEELYQMKRNERVPTMQTQYGVCDKCGNNIRWSGGRDLTKSTRYECRSCGYKGSRPPIYPEPV